ncbi:multiple epidermal growth factor-like domains protein 11 [Ostrea edulis]|uniref:multiple epidermal growth factor-like domains protein 11 n=1 Tax=Ostrea edulis TaxID=37623 RepID=UPI0024AF8CB1|nr:multiple epidermal growth factor-like domains protein 11 [Ostrea edulis]
MARSFRNCLMARVTENDCVSELFPSCVKQDGLVLDLRRLKAKIKILEALHQDFLFANDCALAATSKEDLQKLTDNTSEACDDLSKGKIASQSSTWECNVQTCANLYLASNAVDGDTTTCSRSKWIGPSAPDKTMWWKVDLGAIYSIHSIAILFKDDDSDEQIQRGRFAGFSLYLSNSGVRDSGSPCYLDGPELPPLNFTTTCVGYGRYVTFSNERLDQVKYPAGYEILRVLIELCEVIVKGCQNLGVYGSSCKIPCPKNCQDKICNIVNGTCFGCLPGWTGALCENKCRHGWYGQDCKNRCAGQCRGNTTCNHVTGDCDNGCAAGWMSSRCNEQCIAGTYGPDCIYNCSGHCQNDVICYIETGHCDTGCIPGYTGHFCYELCLPGRFGDRCEERCSGHCLNNKVCHYVDGICTDGCNDGYIGKRCNETCDPGYFGTNCSDVCSENCTNVCRYDDGLCDCYPGHKGPKCNTISGRKSNTEPEYDIPVSWIVGFTVSITLNVFFILIGFINLRKRLIQKESNAGRSDATHYTSTDSIQIESGDTSTDHPKYQELNLTRDENLYQEIQSQRDIT